MTAPGLGDAWRGARASPVSRATPRRPRGARGLEPRGAVATTRRPGALTAANALSAYSEPQNAALGELTHAAQHVGLVPTVPPFAVQSAALDLM